MGQSAAVVTKEKKRTIDLRKLQADWEKIFSVFHVLQTGSSGNNRKWVTLKFEHSERERERVESKQGFYSAALREHELGLGYACP